MAILSSTEGETFVPTTESPKSVLHSRSSCFCRVSLSMSYSTCSSFDRGRFTTACYSSSAIGALSIPLPILSDLTAVPSFNSAWPIFSVGDFSFKRQLSKLMPCVLWMKFTEQCSSFLRSPIGPITVHPKLFQIATGSSTSPALTSNGRKRPGFSFRPINSKTSVSLTAGMSRPCK